MSISFQNISKLYGEQKALDDVSFQIDKGQIVGLLGPNGAGKSTSMKILTCFTSPNSGRAMVAGHDIFEDSLKVRKATGYLPENNPLYLEMYVKEYLSFIGGLFHIKNKKNRIEEMIELTGLSAEQNKTIGALSKGYRQRVGLAQALLHDPEVLILDEPTTGLDPNQIVEIRRLIKNLGKEKTVILSSHIMQEVQAICDRIIIINKGKIVADDTTDNLLGDLHGLKRYRVIFKNNPDRKVFEGIEGLNEIRKEENEWLISAKNENTAEAIFNIAKQLDNPILMLKEESQSLEKVFQELTDNQ